MIEKVEIKNILSVWQRNWIYYSKIWKASIFPKFFEPLIFFVGLGLGVGFYIQEINGVPYAVFITPGLIAMSAMNGASYEATYNVYVRLAYERIYESMMATPLNESEILWGEILWAASRALLYGGIFFFITSLLGMIPSWWGLGVLPVLALTGYFFTTLGMLFSFTIPNIDLFNYYFTLFLTPLYIFSDTFFPIQDRLAQGLKWIPELTPLFHTVRLSRAFCNGEFSWILVWDGAYLLILGIICHILALKAFKVKVHKPV